MVRSHSYFLHIPRVCKNIPKENLYDLSLFVRGLCWRCRGDSVVTIWWPEEDGYGKCTSELVSRWETLTFAYFMLTVNFDAHRFGLLYDPGHAYMTSMSIKSMFCASSCLERNN